MKRIWAFFLLSITLALHPVRAFVPAGADTVEVIGKYVMGDKDSRMDAKMYALLDAKRKAIEHFGTYLTSHTTVRNYQLTSDEINTYAAGFLKTDILDEWLETQGDFTTMYVKIRAVIDPQEVARGLEEIKQQVGEESSFAEMTASFREVLVPGEKRPLLNTPEEERPLRRNWKDQQRFELWVKLSVEAGRKQPDLKRLQQLIAEWDKEFGNPRVVEGQLGIALFKHHRIDEAIPLLERSIRALKQEIVNSKLPQNSPPIRLMTWQLAFYHSYLAKCLHRKGNHHQAHRYETIQRKLMKHLGEREFHHPQ